MDVVHISAWSYLSIDLIQAAAYFARQSLRREKAHASVYSAVGLAEHRSYVIGSILTVASFLEATINELFAEAADRNTERVGVLGDSVVSEMATKWQTPRFVKNTQTLAKFQTALDIGGKERFDEKIAPYEEVFLVMALRHALVHYKPEWKPSGNPSQTPENEVQVETRLPGKFATNPLMAGLGNPFFPDQCLGHGCAAWAVSRGI